MPHRHRPSYRIVRRPCWRRSRAKRRPTRGECGDRPKNNCCRFHEIDITSPREGPLYVNWLEEPPRVLPAGRRQWRSNSRYRPTAVWRTPGKRQSKRENWKWAFYKPLTSPSANKVRDTELRSA
jgi:hypothetical protein